MACVKKVLIVGGSLSGLTAAIALRKNGIACDVVESARETIGAAIVIQGGAMAAFDEFGLREKCEAIAAISPLDDDTGLFDMAGNRLVETGPPVGSLHYGFYRPTLWKILHEEALRRGAHVRTGIGLASLTQSENGVQAHFTDGTSADYELLIGADGVRSTVRNQVFGDTIKPHYTGQCYIRWMTPGEAIASGPTSSYITPYGKVLGYALPYGKLIYAISVFASDEPKILDDSESRTLLNAQLAPFTAPYVVDLRNRLTPDIPLLCRAFESLLMPDPWYRGRVVMVGDAAHATTAHVGAGGAMGMCDSMVLANCLARAHSIEEALDTYMRRRFEPVSTVVETSATLSRLEAEGAPLAQLKERASFAKHAIAAAY